MPCPICTGALISKAAASTAAALGVAKRVKDSKKLKSKSKGKQLKKKNP